MIFFLLDCLGDDSAKVYRKQTAVVFLFHGRKGSKIRHSGLHYLKVSNNKCIIKLYKINFKIIYIKHTELHIIIDISSKYPAETVHGTKLL